MSNTKKQSKWQQIINEEKKKPYYMNLMAKIELEEEKGVKVLPIKKDRLKALKCCEFGDVKVVILGQDPYYNPEKAMGLAFSVPEGVKTPPSLKNIFKELKDDLKVNHKSSDLTGWSKQGVLLLNTILTVEENRPGSHAKYGWERFTDKLLLELDKSDQPIVFVLWGKIAWQKERLFNNPKHLILKSYHPSPLGAYNGFFGSKPFSKINEYLITNGQEPIDWSK